MTCDCSLETIPIFQFPLGFHTISLWYLAQYYDGTARPFYGHFLLYPEQNPLPTSAQVDYGRILTRICQFVLRSDSASDSEISMFLTPFYDRNANFAALLHTRSPAGDSYVITRVPRGSEDGIVPFLRQTTEFGCGYVFALNFVDDLIDSVAITAGQPFLMNSLILREFSTKETVAAKSTLIEQRITSLKIGIFQVDWAIVSISGSMSLVICRPPNFYRIGDNFSMVYESDKVFEGAKIAIVCYRHLSFISRRQFNIKPEKSTIFHWPYLPTDSLWCSVLQSKIDTWKAEKHSFVGYLSNCLRTPAYYFIQSGNDNLTSAAASVFIDLPGNTAAAESIASKFIIPGVKLGHVSAQIAEFQKFCFWVRATVRLLKSFVVGDLRQVELSLLGIFRVLPQKNHTLVSYSVLFCAEAIRIFHPQRGRTEEFYGAVVKIYRFIFGDQFDNIMGIPNYDVPRPLRSQLVSLDTCQKQFFSVPFKRTVQSIAPVLTRLNKYYQGAVNHKGLKFPERLPSFKLDPVYLGFLKREPVDKSIEM
jgi:hypothetical protein